jgi:secondary thiamine-phosphate synthase enzyme
MRQLKYFKTTAKTFTDITADIADNIKSILPQYSDYNLVNIYSRHTTCGIAVLENEKLLLADYERILQDFAPKQAFYAHNIIAARDVPPDERINGHAHIRALFFQPSVTLPLHNKELLLGKWQSIFLVELDPSRQREIIITII